MRNKGFFWSLTFVLIIVCIYQLSFTWISGSVEEQAQKQAAQQVAELREEVKKTGEAVALPNGTTVDFSKPEDQDLAMAAFVNENLKQKANVETYPVLGFNFQEVKSRSLAFGLDLVGGMSVTLEISVPDLVMSFARNPRDLRFKKPFDEALYAYRTTGGDFIDLFIKRFEAKNGKALLVKELSILEIDELDKNSSNSDVAKFFRNKISSSMNGVEQIMGKRINQFGVAQPNIQKDPSNNRLYIELPGVQDEATVASKLVSTANLQMYETYNKEELAAQLSQAHMLSLQDEIIVEEVDTTSAPDTTGGVKPDTTKKPAAAPLNLNTTKKGLQDYITGGGLATYGYVKPEDKEKVNKIIRRKDVRAALPPDLELMWSANPEKESFEEKVATKYALYLIKIPESRKAYVGGKDIKSAARGVDPGSGKITVDVSMTIEGSDKWSEMTSRNVGRCVAISMDSVVYSAPRVNEPITQGNTQISGNFSMEDAEDLAGLLNGGALPAPCVIKEQTKVGPTIGAENSRAGLISFGFAFLAVLCYMFFYYGKGGLSANMALTLNVIFIFGCLASFGAVLTLAGIAGIVLTIGTAVDANILIFERIREEENRGVDKKSAIEIGFKKALPSILDANVAHLLVAIILKVFGTGEIESFATTLIIGIFTSLFSAIIISKLIITRWQEKGQNISFYTSMSKGLFQNFHFDWVGKRKYFYIFSISVSIIGIAAIATRGLKQSVEFTGGRTFTVKFDKKADIERIRKDLSTLFIENGEIASIDLKTKSNDYNVEIVTNYKLRDDGATQEVTDKLKKGLEAGKKVNGGFEIKESRSISASVSSELWKSSTIAITFALIVIFAYILIRFGRWQYSFATIVSLFHDVLFVLSLFALLHGFLPFNLDVNQAFIAAVLTVIGYSMNDTVIVFDRIRENLVLYKDEDTKTIINKSLNTTLSRTFNTSMILFVVLLIMFIFGGPAIKSFGFALLVGVVIGTYSSLCVGTPILIDFSKKLQEKK